MTDKNGGQQRDKNGHFLPGNGGGPGRPTKDKCVTDLMRTELEKTETVKGKKVTYLQLFVESQIKRAINGDAAAAKNLWERIEGRVPAALEVSGEGGGPITVVYDQDFSGV